MDIIKGYEQELFQKNALHTSRLPQTEWISSQITNEFEENNSKLIGDFATRRARSAAENRRFAALSHGGAGSGDVMAAIPRFYNPEEYFIQTQVPYNIADERQRVELLKWMQLFYKTHSLIPILVDIFTRFPLVGMEVDSKDRELNTFYEDLFFDDLDYEQHLVDIGREYWTLGESWPLGHFNENLGIWESEELLDPTAVTVKRYPIVGTESFTLKPPADLIEIAKRKKPEPVWALLQKNHADLIPFLLQEREIPVSDVLLKQVAYKVSPRDLHGTPILLRVLRQLIHEEKLMAAQDAVAERLYSPLLLVKLGVQDLGNNRGAWIPGPEHVAALRNDLDLALSADFRLLVHHFGIEVQNVWGREQMPRLDADFDRIERKLMQTFGVNPNLLAGGASAQPYASSALQAEFLNQILRTYQKYLKRYYDSRAAVVAEAQGHYAYEKRGESRIPIMEEVVEYDDDGNEVIVEKRKLMWPELKMKVLDLRDEATQRQFLQVLRQAGVPVPDEDLAMGMGYIFEESLERYEEEMVQKTVAQQEAKVKAYDILSARGYPIPADLKAEIEGAGAGMAPGQQGTFDVNAPTPGEPIVMPDAPDLGADNGPPGGAPPIGPNDAMRGTVPEQSLERSPLTGPGGLMSPVGPGGAGGAGVPGGVGLSSHHPRRGILKNAGTHDEYIVEREGNPRRGPSELEKLADFDLRDYQE